ncbi:MAG: flagellar hook-associated family protein [Rhizobiaceae bacterium]
MKTSFVSSSAISQAMRYSLQRMQLELVGAQKEASTGRVADAGLALGARTGQSVSFARDVERLNGIVDSNKLIAARLKSTQDSLSQLTTVGQTFLATLTASASGDASIGVTLTEAKGTLQALTSILNTSLNGEHLFAGINTDASPIVDFTKPGAPNKSAFDAAFLAHFGFTQSDPQTANITSTQMSNFLTVAVEPQFTGAGWQANWSNASDQRITSRIALNETAQTSVSANEAGVRKLAMASAAITDLFDSQLSGGARDALVNRAIELVGEALSSITNTQSELGITQNRVTRASDRVDMQIDLFERNILDMEGVDPYEASTRVSSLLQQIETSYAMTARIQQLSLLKYLS